jgi:hypothetical protein
MISKGVVQVNGYDKDEVDITFFGDNIDVFELIKGKKLREIDLSNLRHTYTAGNITGSFTNESGYIYLPIDYGLFTDRASMTIASGEIYPAIFLPDVLTAVFKLIGYKVEGSLLNRALFKKSVLPFGNNVFGYSKEFVESKNFYVDNLTPFTIGAGLTVKHDFNRELDTSLGSVFGGNDLFNLTTERYTADDDYQINLIYDYDFRVFTRLNGAVAAPTISIKKNGVTIATAPSNVKIISVTTTLNSGDYLEAYVQNNHSGSITFGGTFTGNVSQNFVTGSVIYPETVLPDMEITDFLKWVLFRFLGVLSIDPFSKTCYLNQFNDLKNNDVDDWSDKVDLSRTVDTNYNKLLSKFGKVNVAKYKEDDKDVYQTNYNVDNDYPFGSGTFEINNDFIEGEKTIFETKFSPTFLINSFDANQLLIPYIPRHLPDDDDINVPEPRVLTVYGNLDISQFSQVTSISILGSTVTSIPFSYFYKSIYGFEVDDFKESLAFGVQNIFAPNDLGAFESDYLQLINILQTPSVKRAYLKLNQIDMVNLDFLKKKYFERFGGYFYLNIIEDYDGSGDSVKCELIKL